MEVKGEEPRAEDAKDATEDKERISRRPDRRNKIISEPETARL